MALGYGSRPGTVGLAGPAWAAHETVTLTTGVAGRGGVHVGWGGHGDGAVCGGAEGRALYHCSGREMGAEKVNFTLLVLQSCYSVEQHNVK